MADYVLAAKEAASAFGFVDADVEILSKSENTVCKLTTGDQKFVMRLHRPGYNTRAELESEVQWVRSLDGDGIPVPSAVPTLDGGNYSTVEIDGQPVQVGVVEWVHGRPLAEIYEDSGTGRSLDDDYRRIGEISAQIRHHGENWTPPLGFVRRCWDTDALLGESPSWGRFWEVDRLSAAQRRLFAHARALLTTELTQMGTTSSNFGLIHADLHLGNVMANGDELTIIDFDDSGYSWFAYDLAVALQPIVKNDLYESARASMLEGYRAIHPFTDDEEAAIDTFLTVRSLIDVSWLDERPELGHDDKMPGLIALAEQMASEYVGAAS